MLQPHIRSDTVDVSEVEEPLAHDRANMASTRVQGNCPDGADFAVGDEQALAVGG